MICLLIGCLVWSLPISCGFCGGGAGEVGVVSDRIDARRGGKEGLALVGDQARLMPGVECDDHREE